MMTIKQRIISGFMLCGLIVGGALQVHAQESALTRLSYEDKSAIVQAVLGEDLKLQIAEFNGIITILSSQNIEPIEPTVISRLGFTLISPASISEWRANSVIRYVVFKGIEVKGNKAIVALSRVVEGRPCSGPRFSTEQSFIYRYDSEAGRWIGAEIRRPPQRPGPLRESTQWSRSTGAPLRIKDVH